MKITPKTYVKMEAQKMRRKIHCNRLQTIVRMKIAKKYNENNGGE